MPYKCPVCDQVFQANGDIADHIIGNSSISEKHLNWIVDRVTYYTSVLGMRNKNPSSKNNQPLTDIIENECKLKE